MPFSLMNGLSGLGAGVAQFAGQAGLEAQKADLAQQQAVLADHLATVRETGLARRGIPSAGCSPSPAWRGSRPGRG
jgi:hypothetical protein